MTAHDAPPDATPSERLMRTGIPGLDTLLGGGIPRGSLLLVVGAPGTGKTVLTQQLCFNQAANGTGKALYFTTLSEPHDKMINQLQPFRFYNPSELGAGVQLLALQEFLKQGLEATAEVIVRMARQQRSTLICIDGFRAIEAVSQNEVETRQFLYQLSAQLHLLGITALVTLERAAQDRDDYGAYTVADGVLTCRHDLNGVQLKRWVEVKKLRSMSHLYGLHSYRIDRDGWTIYPRIEALVASETSDPPQTGEAERVSFGIPALDQLFGGGLPFGSTTLLAGGAGVGKTLLGIHFLAEGLRRQEPSLFIGFNERRRYLLAKAKHFGLPLEEGEQQGLLRLHTFAPVEVDPDAIANVIRHEVSAGGIRRLLIDSAFDLERATAQEGRTSDYLGALVTYLRDARVTVCMTRPVNKLIGAELDFSETPLAVVAENLLLLRHVEQNTTPYRVLAVLKMRDSDCDRGIYEYLIGEGGLTIKGRFEPANALVDLARSLPPAKP